MVEYIASARNVNSLGNADGTTDAVRCDGPENDEELHSESDLNLFWDELTVFKRLFMYLPCFPLGSFFFSAMCWSGTGAVTITSLVDFISLICVSRELVL